MDVADVVRSVVRGLGPRLTDAGPALGLRLAPAPVCGDPTRLAQVGTNLLTNAVKFIPVGGRVAVTTDVVADSVRLTDGDGVPGISDGELPRVFDRYFRGRGSAANDGAVEAANACWGGAPVGSPGRAVEDDAATVPRGSREAGTRAQRHGPLSWVAVLLAGSVCIAVVVAVESVARVPDSGHAALDEWVPWLLPAARLAGDLAAAGDLAGCAVGRVRGSPAAGPPGGGPQHGLLAGLVPRAGGRRRAHCVRCVVAPPPGPWAPESGQAGAFWRIAAIELLVFAITLGRAVGLSRTPAPVHAPTEVESSLPVPSAR
ncbi:sensor histidine kinase [Klenkia terrae]|uniref:histidine kinase n=1 Tax=Klenkia terrae TaxID=1052259 RepID=A0ABU8E4S6_9ACTN|nr:HAMP domain-containing sensor histidine kinase [Klenkia terrae]